MEIYFHILINNLNKIWKYIQFDALLFANKMYLRS